MAIDWTTVYDMLGSSPSLLEVFLAASLNFVLSQVFMMEKTVLVYVVFISASEIKNVFVVDNSKI